MAPPRTPSIFEEEGYSNEDMRSQNARFAEEIERLRDELAAAHSTAEQVWRLACSMAAGMLALDHLICEPSFVCVFAS